MARLTFTSFREAGAFLFPHSGRFKEVVREPTRKSVTTEAEERADARSNDEVLAETLGVTTQEVRRIRKGV